MLGILMVVDIVISSAMILGGLVLSRLVSSRPSNMIGWKSRRGSQSRSARKYANNTGGLLWMSFGTVELVLSLVIPTMFSNSFGDDTAGIAAAGLLLFIITSFVATIVIVESLLKKNFEDNS